MPEGVGGPGPEEREQISNQAEDLYTEHRGVQESIGQTHKDLKEIRAQAHTEFAETGNASPRETSERLEELSDSLPDMRAQNADNVQRAEDFVMGNQSALWQMGAREMQQETGEKPFTKPGDKHYRPSSEESDEQKAA
jgi:hypothetical protein